MDDELKKIIDKLNKAILDTENKLKAWELVDSDFYYSYEVDCLNMKEEIRRHIEDKKNTLKALYEELNNVEKNYTDFKEGFRKLLSNLRDNTSKDIYSPILVVYEIRNSVVNNVFN